MSAPILFVLVPALAGLLTVLLRSRLNWVDAAVVAFTGLLAVLAFLAPIEAPWVVRGLVVRMSPAWIILGRALVIDAGLIDVVGVVYSAAFIWFLAALFTRENDYLVSFGLMSIAMLVGAASVQPWGFVGIFLLFAVFFWVPLLSPPGAHWKQSVINFLGFQLLGVPFLLLAGALINGLESTPPGLRIVERPAIFLGMGFALVLALFPFHSWMPRLVEEADPFAAAFVLFFLPGFSGLIFLQVVDQHVWLRNSGEMFTLLRTIGILTASIGGFLVVFQRSLARILGFAALIETGIMLLAIGSGPRTASTLFFPLLVSRGVGFMVWGLGLSAAKEARGSLDFRAVQGLLRDRRIIGVAVVVGAYSSAGLPLLMGFVTRLPLYAALSENAPSAAAAVWFGSLGLLFAATRSLAVLVMHPQDAEMPAAPSEVVELGRRWVYRFQGWLILAACLLLVLTGVFPAWLDPIIDQLPFAFNHLRP